MTRILVTGATGFLGRAVVTAFVEDGYLVRAATRSQPKPPFGANVEVVMHPDLADPVDWRPLLDGIDVVIHLAGIAHITTSLGPDLYDRVNHLATAQAAATAAQRGIRRFVFVSSIRAQSGPASNHALTECDPPTPSDAYGRSKLAAEAAVALSGVPFTILRPVLLYGPGVKGNLATLLRAARSPWPLPVKLFGNRRSLLGITHFISALRFVLSAPQTIGATYVVADPGIPPSIGELIAMMREAQGRRPRLVAIPPALFELPLRLLGRGELWHRLGGDLRVDPGKLIAAGWKPPEDTRTGIAAMVQAAQTA
jgi:nucleoside-diphosphate-sugar epimerase